MAYLDNYNYYVPKSPVTDPQAYAAQYPAWETQTPQYPLPLPYTLAVEGYRKNEILYACIEVWMEAMAEAPLKIYIEGADNDEEQPQHALRKLIKRPNPYMTEEQYWRQDTCYRRIAGFSLAEIEFNRMGEPIALWPMRPDWCSFLRGDKQPVRAIRYAPWGLTPVDIPYQKVLYTSYFDPIFPFMKGLSPTAVAMRVANVDNKATDFLQIFFQRGAMPQGIFTTTQSLGQPEADRMRRDYRERHGGIQNWGDPVFLGSGATYTQTQMNMRDMQFSELDGRNESRICTVMRVSPILVNAKVGMGAMTYHNYMESKKAFHEGPVSAERLYVASEVREQLLQFYGDDENTIVKFDTSKVRALQDDRDSKFKRADEGYKGNWMTLNDARQEAEFDPVENGDKFLNGSTPSEDAPPEPASSFPAQFGAQAIPTGETPTPDEQLKNLERRQFRTFAGKRAKEGKPEQAEEFKFHHLPEPEQRALLASVAMLSEPTNDLAAAVAELRRYNELAGAR